MNAFLKTLAPPVEDAGQKATDDLVSFVHNASETSKREIDHLIDELKGLQKKLDDEGNRVRQQIVDYASLNQSAFQLIKIVLDEVPIANYKMLPNREPEGS
jgi:hypothetical protein